MRFRLFAVCCLLAGALAGCRGGWTGMAGTSLVRTEYPRLSIAANEPLTLQGYGRLWVSFPTQYLGLMPSGIMQYAVYGEERDGVLLRHAHILIARPNRDNYWVFELEGYPVPGGFGIGRADMGGWRWVSQLVRVDGEKDWFSAMWRESGRKVPAFWLSRRFSTTPERSMRVAAEYREPWPECLDPAVKDLALVPAACLEGFLQRSEAAFEFSQKAPEEPRGADVPSNLRQPGFPPDMKRLAGELMEDLRIQFWR